jgi:hypothetical protein
MTVPKDPATEIVWEQSEDRVQMHGPGARLVVTRMGAVWTHSLVLAGDPGVEIVRAVETDPERDDPGRIVSPVYQEIQRHQASGLAGLCLLATGTLARHHFSAVITLGNDPDRAGGLMLDVDVAATYSVNLDTGALRDAGEQGIEWEILEGSIRNLELEAVAPSTLALAEAGRTAMRAQVVAAIKTGSFTHRVHYRWRWAISSGLTR